MRRLVPIALIVLMAAVSFGFRGSTWRGARTVTGDYTFSGTATFQGAVDGDSLDADHLTVNTTGYFGGKLEVNDASMWIYDDSLFFTDGGADTSYVVQDGTYLKFGSDNPFYFTDNIYTSGIAMRGVNDTLTTLGSAATRWKEVNALRLRWSDGTKADSGKVYDDGSNSVIDTDNEVKFTNSVMFGGIGVAIDSVKVNGGNLEFYVDGSVYNAAVP